MMQALTLESALREIHKAGWLVAVHNDYVLGDRIYAFWLFTNSKTGRFVKVEGESNWEIVNNAYRMMLKMDAGEK